MLPFNMKLHWMIVWEYSGYSHFWPNPWTNSLTMTLGERDGEATPGDRRSFGLSNLPRAPRRASTAQHQTFVSSAMAAASASDLGGHGLWVVPQQVVVLEIQRWTVVTREVCLAKGLCPELDEFHMMFHVFSLILPMSGFLTQTGFPH